MYFNRNVEEKAGTSCDMNFTTRFNAKRHEKEKHVRETRTGYILIDHDHEDSDS